MNNSINIVTIASCSLQINDKRVPKIVRRREYEPKTEVNVRKQKYNWRI